MEKEQNFRFCYSMSATRTKAQPCSREQFQALIQSPETKHKCDLLALIIEDPSAPEALEFVRNIDTSRWSEDEKKDWQETLQNPTYKAMKRYIKEQLPVIYPHASRFIDDQRIDTKAVASGLAMLDIDDKNFAASNLPIDPGALWEKVTKAQIAEHQIAMAHITPSSRGLRVIAQRRAGESIPQCQARLAHMLGVTKWDSTTTNPSRCSFVVPEGYIRYIDEVLLTTIDSDAQNAQLPAVAEPQSPDANTADKADNTATQTEETYYSLPFKYIIEYIIHEWESKEPNCKLDEGNRHPCYDYVAKYARELVNNDPERLFQVMGDFKGLPVGERRKLCEWWCNPERDRYGIDQKVIQDALEYAREFIPEEDKKVETGVRRLHMPEMPQLFKTLYGHLDSLYRVPCVLSALPALGALANVRFQYRNDDKRALTFFALLVAKSSQGKSTFNPGLKLLTRRLYEEDAKADAMSRAYREEKEDAKNAEVQPKKPSVKKRLLASRVTSLAWYDQMYVNPDTPMYLATTEIDAIYEAMKERGNIGTDDLRKAWDHEDIGYQSMTYGSVRVYPYMSIYTQGTYDAKDRFFRNFNDGTSARFMVIELPSLGYSTTSPTPFTDEERQYIADIADWLLSLSGVVDCPWINEAAQQFCDDKACLAARSGNDLLLESFHRAGTHGAKAGILASLLFMYDEHKGTKGFELSPDNQRKAAAICRFVAEYQLRSQMTFFDADKIREEKIIKKAEMKQMATALSALQDNPDYAQLPTDFTRRQFYDALSKRGIKQDTAKRTLQRWRKDYHWVEVDAQDKNLFHKVA